MDDPRRSFSYSVSLDRYVSPSRIIEYESSIAVGLTFPSHDIDVVHDFVQAHYKGRFGEEGTGRKRGWSEKDVRRLVQPAELLHADEAEKRRIHAQGRHQIDACQGRDLGARYTFIIQRSVDTIAPGLFSSIVAPALQNRSNNGTY